MAPIQLDHGSHSKGRAFNEETLTTSDGSCFVLRRKRTGSLPSIDATDKTARKVNKCTSTDSIPVAFRISGFAKKQHRIAAGCTKRSSSLPSSVVKDVALRQGITEDDSADAGVRPRSRTRSSNSSGHSNSTRVTILDSSSGSEFFSKCSSHSFSPSKIGKRSVSSPSKTTSADSVKCYGFEQGDWVSTGKGQDADGPWRDLGIGKVMGPSALRPGLLDVLFENGDTFAIRAKNLSKTAAPSAVFRTTRDNDTGTFMEKDAIWYKDIYGRGVVMGPGPSPGELFVKFGGLGVRVVDTNDCTKVRTTVDVGSSSLDAKRKSRRATSSWKDIRKMAAQEEEVRASEMEAALLASKLARFTQDRIGARVEAKDYPWKDMGVGLVKQVHEDFAMVQFDVTGDLYSLAWEDLDIMNENRSLEIMKRRRKFDRPNKNMVAFDDEATAIR